MKLDNFHAYVVKPRGLDPLEEGYVKLGWKGKLKDEQIGSIWRIPEGNYETFLEQLNFIEDARKNGTIE